MKRNFGRFKDVKYQTGGSVLSDPEADAGGVDLPPIMGSPLPSSGIRDNTLGQVFSKKKAPTPKLYAEQLASKKRMKNVQSPSGLGPITGGPPSGFAAQSGPSSRGQSDPTMGDRWMGEIWQQLSPGELVQSQGQGIRGLGYANGGSVDELMSVYNQTMTNLESGGIGYANGGAVDQSRQIASMGRGGDSMLMHINPAELEGLQSLLGPISVNPDTGNPEAFPWLPLLGLAAGAIGGGAMSDWEAGPMIMGGIAGLTMGMGGAALAGPAAASSGPAIAGAGTSLASTTAIPAGGALAGTSGLTWGPATAGLANVAAGGAGTAVPGAVTASQLAASGAGTSGLLGGMDGQKALETGLGMVQQSGQRPQQPTPSPLGLDEPPPPKQFAQSGHIVRPPRRRRRPAAGGSGRIGNVLA